MGDGHRPAQVHRLRGVHRGLPVGEQDRPRRRLPAGPRRDRGSLPRRQADLHAQALHALRKPACLTACSADAIKKTPDGIVYVDYETCVGLKACIPACPYGVPKFDEGGYFTDNTPKVQDYEKAAAYEMGVKRPRNMADKAPMGRMRKCHYCFHRLQAGALPACTTTCIGHATFFGDIKDEQSLISEMSRSPRVRRLNESAGTKPTTFLPGLA